MQLQLGLFLLLDLAPFLLFFKRKVLNFLLIWYLQNLLAQNLAHIRPQKKSLLVDILLNE